MCAYQLTFRCRISFIILILLAQIDTTRLMYVFIIITTSSCTHCSLCGTDDSIVKVFLYEKNNKKYFKQQGLKREIFLLVTNYLSWCFYWNVNFQCDVNLASLTSTSRAVLLTRKLKAYVSVIYRDGVQCSDPLRGNLVPVKS